MTDSKVQERFESFARGFLLPILEGGRVSVGRPLTPGMLPAFSRSRSIDGELDRAILDSVRRSAAEVAPLGDPRWPALGFSSIAMAAHNLLSVTDPRFLRLGSRGARSVLLRWVGWFLQQAGAPRTRADVLARHAFVDRFLDLRREDITMRNWAFSHHYLGRPVPAGFFSKPRWVETRRRQRGIFELLDAVDSDLRAGSHAADLLSRTPLTQLLHCDTVGDFAFTGAVLAVLSDSRLRGGAARGLVARGRSVMGALGRALRQLGEAQPEAIFIQYAVALMYEMHVIATLDARVSRPPLFSDPAGEDEAFFCAVLPATLTTPMAQGLFLNPLDISAVEKRGTELARASGQPALSALLALVERAGNDGSNDVVSEEAS